MNKNQERRQFSRVDFNTEATLLQNGAQWQTAVIDISLKGLLVNGSLPDEWDAQQMVDVSIPLSGTTSIECAQNSPIRRRIIVVLPVFPLALKALRICAAW